LTLAVLCTICIGALLIALQNYIVYLFTSDRSVISMASKLVYLVVVVEGFDSLEVVSMGVVRGLGYQKHGAIITFISFLCIGTASSLILIFNVHLKVPGFWIGIAIGVVFQTIALFILLWKIDWTKVSASVRENVGVVETASNDLKSHPAGDESERQNLNASSQDSRQYAANVEHPSIDIYADDVCLITETISPSSGRSDHNRSDKSKGTCKTTGDAAPIVCQVSDVDVCIIYDSPHLSKLDIFIKVSVALFFLCGIAASAVARIYL